jgi:hypothetical protein
MCACVRVCPIGLLKFVEYVMSCMCTHTHTHTYTHTHTMHRCPIGLRTSIYICNVMYVCMSVYVYVLCVCVCVHVCMHVCVYVCTSVCECMKIFCEWMNECMNAWINDWIHTHTCTHTHTHSKNRVQCHCSGYFFFLRKRVLCLLYSVTIQSLSVYTTSSHCRITHCKNNLNLYTMSATN